MTWGLASSVARLARAVIAAPAFSESNQPEAISGPVVTTLPMQSADETQRLLLIARRAERLNNRSRKAANRYIETHKALCHCEVR